MALHLCRFIIPFWFNWFNFFDWKIDYRKYRLLNHGQFNKAKFISYLFKRYFGVFVSCFFGSINLWDFRMKKHRQQLYLEIFWEYIWTGNNQLLYLLQSNAWWWLFWSCVLHIFTHVLCVLFVFRIIHFYSPLFLIIMFSTNLVYNFFCCCLLYQWWNSSDNYSYKCMPALIQIDKKISIV